LRFFPSQNSKLTYINVELLLLKPMHGNGVVHLTVLAHGKKVSLNPGWSAGYEILFGGGTMIAPSLCHVLTLTHKHAIVAACLSHVAATSASRHTIWFVVSLFLPPPIWSSDSPLIG